MRRLVHVAFAAVLTAPASAQTASYAPPDPARFKTAIEAFAKRDSTARPAPGGIVFVGSSIVRQWADLEAQMAPLPVYNRGFGGSQTPDVLVFAETLVFQYKPRFVVYYCGSNDVNARSPASETVARVREFHDRLQKALPNARMFFMSVIRSPEKRARWAVVDSINAQMRSYIATAKNIEYIDLNPAILDTKGDVRGELYRPDSLHYNPPAYVLFAAIVKPVLENAWAGR